MKSNFLNSFFDSESEIIKKIKESEKIVKPFRIIKLDFSEYKFLFCVTMKNKKAISKPIPNTTNPFIIKGRILRSSFVYSIAMK